LCQEKGKRTIQYIGAAAGCFGKPIESPLRSVIVIGGSAGDRHALKEIVKGLSADLPAVVITFTALR